MSRDAIHGLTILSLATLVGCAPLDTYAAGEQIDLSVESASLQSAADKLLVFGMKQPVTLTRSATAQAFTFELSDRASVVLSTHADESGRQVDTVLALYRERAHGWGPVFASNDDYDHARFSNITRELPQGRYRLQVKGFRRASVGSFTLASRCVGKGCPPLATSCLFGADASELGHRNEVVVSRSDSISAADQVFGELQHQQFLQAVRLAAPEARDVTEALTRVDGGTVQRSWLWDALGSRQFIAYQYTFQQITYGAVFTQNAAELVARVEAGTFTACSVRPEHCLFGNTYHELRESRAFQLESASVVTPATVAELSTLQQAQLLAAVQVAYEEASDGSALSSVDQNEINRVLLRERASGRSFTAYEYGAGDNSYGAVFESDSTSMATQIQDGDLYGCRVFAP